MPVGLSDRIFASGIKFIFMKTCIKLLLVIWVLASINPVYLLAKNDPDNSSAVIVTKRESSTTRPRSIVRQQILCMYDVDFNTLHFQFLDDIGIATISVANTTTGEIFYYIGASTPGECTMEISDESGAYTIYIEDGHGQMYDGFFMK